MGSFKKINMFNKNKGFAMTIVSAALVTTALLSGYVANFAYNKHKLIVSTSNLRIKIFYRAKAGTLDAIVRIRTNYTVGLSPAGSFTTPTYNPGMYSLDVDENGVNDTQVDIGPVDPATGLRPIVSKGLDTD